MLLAPFTFCSGGVVDTCAKRQKNHTIHKTDGGMLRHGLCLFVADEWELGNLGGLVPPGLAKGDEATHSPRSWESKGSRKFLAPLKRVSVILSSRRVAREKGITRATQGKKEVGSGVSGGTREGCVGLHNHL